MKVNNTYVLRVQNTYKKFPINSLDSTRAAANALSLGPCFPF